MLLESLREQVLRANREIARRGLAPHTFGNASGVDRSGAKPLVVIKPSGVDYFSLTSAILVVTDLDGNIVEGDAAPVERPRYPHPALPRIPADRRHRPHPLRVRHLLGPGWPPHPLPRHHPRRLLSRSRSRHRAAYRRRGR